MSLTIRDGLAELARDLDGGGIVGAPREARLLLAHVLGVEAARMSVMAPEPLDPAVLKRARGVAGRRIAGEPMSHILGYRAFWGRRFQVDGRVLDPRPETEVLVSLALKRRFADVLDLGTGSGCILLTLLCERPRAKGVGVDVSPDALDVAGKNAEALAVADRTVLGVSNWYSAVGGRFDLIVSNPPYIAADEMPGLARELGHEPRRALTDEGDGLSAYRAIAAGAGEHLNPGGGVLVEIGPSQADPVARIFRTAGLDVTGVHYDFDGRNRVISASAPDFA